MRRFGPLILILVLCSVIACDESESTLGAAPGGDPAGAWDSLEVDRLALFHRNQLLWDAGRQVVGRLDARSLEAEILFQVDYQPVQLWEAQPDSGSLSALLSLKMDNDPERVLLPQHSDSAGVGFYMNLSLLLLELPEGENLPYEDSLSWEYAHPAGEDRYTVLDSVVFLVSNTDSAFGEGGDPLTGVRTLREVPAWWFEDSNSTSRSFLLRAAPGEQGLLPFLAAGWNSEVRPGIRLAWSETDTTDTGDSVFVDTSMDTTFVVCTWQSGIVDDYGPADSLWLSTGYANQVILELPPFQPADENGEAVDFLLGSISEGLLGFPIDSHVYNTAGGKVNLYHVGQYQELGQDLDPSMLVAGMVLDDSTEFLEFNVVNLLRRIWVEEDTLSSEEPIALALKFDDYFALEVRKLGLHGLAAEDSLRPRLRYKISHAPEHWGQP